MGQTVRRYYISTENIENVKKYLGISVSDAIRVARLIIFTASDKEIFEKLDKHIAEFAKNDDKVAVTVSIDEITANTIDALAERYCYNNKSCVVDFLVQEVFERWDNNDELVTNYVDCVRALRNLEDDSEADELMFELKEMMNG